MELSIFDGPFIGRRLFSDAEFAILVQIDFRIPRDFPRVS